MTHCYPVFTFILCCLLSAACGGGAPSVEAPDEAPDDASVTADDAQPPAPAGDGIVRDADGDGVPDDTGGAASCAGKNETQCKINADCAWSEDGKCTEATDSPM